MLEGLLLHPRHPVGQIFEPARNGEIILRRGDHHRPYAPDFLDKLLDRRRYAMRRFLVAVVDGQPLGRNDADVERVRCALLHRPEERRVEGA